MRVINESAHFQTGTDLTGKSWAVRIIEGDRQGASAYYPRQVLEAAAPLFKGKPIRIFSDHPTPTEQDERPVRSVKDIVGFVQEGVKFDGKDLVGEVTFLPSQIERYRELAEAGLIGLSIRARGDFAEDGNTLAKFEHIYSVDVITDAGAGGEFRSITESSASMSGAESHQMEEVDMTPEELNEALAAQKGELLDAVKDLITEALKPLAPKAPEPVKVKLADVDAALTEAELSPTGRKLVLEAFEAGKDYKVILEAEKARENEIRESVGGFKGGHHQELTEADGDDLATKMFGA